MSKISTSRYFEDFRLNEVIDHATPRTLSSGDSAVYQALYGYRNPLFCSAPFAHDLGYPQMPIDDLLAFHIAFGKTVPDISVNAVANLGYADVRFLEPVYAGDTLRTSSKVIGLKQNSSAKSGVVWVHSTCTNQHNTPVLSWVRWVMVHKNRIDAPPPDTVVPQLPSVVLPEELNISKLQTQGFDASATGGQHYWEDYAIGERINHVAGMTINPADHVMATRLYQNNARLHFDDYLMQGKRLVYGGVIISICRTLSFDGLENALRILSINAGTHANPSYAGDTIYTRTEVMEKYDLSANAGALRLRMVGIKNLPSTELNEIKLDTGYHANVVLDLDYTVLMPKKGSQ